MLSLCCCVESNGQNAHVKSYFIVCTCHVHAFKCTYNKCITRLKLELGWGLVQYHFSLTLHSLQKTIRSTLFISMLCNHYDYHVLRIKQIKSPFGIIVHMPMPQLYRSITLMERHTIRLTQLHPPFPRSFCHYLRRHLLSHHRQTAP